MTEMSNNELDLNDISCTPLEISKLAVSAAKVSVLHNKSRGKYDVIK